MHNKIAHLGSRIEIVDLTRAQPDLLAHLAIDHLQLERLDLIFELVDRLDELLRGLLRFKCRLTSAPALLLKPRNSSVLNVLNLDRAQSRAKNPCPG
jgi:hypothetical protein